MKKISYLRLRAVLLSRLYREQCFGQKQMLLENVAKFAREEKHVAEAVLHKLVAQGFLFAKPKNYGVHVWINTERLDEIRDIVSEVNRTEDADGETP